MTVIGFLNVSEYYSRQSVLHEGSTTGYLTIVLLCKKARAARETPPTASKIRESDCPISPISLIIYR